MATALKAKAAKQKSRVPARAATSKAARSSGVLYLYAISLPVRKRVEIRAEAVDGEAAIEPLAFEGFDCWISRVDRSEYADHLAENMENLEWLAMIGVRHQRAVADLASKVAILPARFGTVFLSEESLKEHLASGKKNFQSVFKKIAGADEWGVKVFRVAQTGRPAMTEAASGTDYLKRKAQSVMPRTKEEDPALAELVRALTGLSVDAAPGGKASSGQPSLIWHGSFLVRRTAQKKFASALRKFTAAFSEGYRVECSGPWPPYSFVGQHG
jgi:hypothetical protein